MRAAWIFSKFQSSKNEFIESIRMKRSIYGTYVGVEKKLFVLSSIKFTQEKSTSQLHMQSPNTKK